MVIVSTNVSKSALPMEEIKIMLGAQVQTYEAIKDIFGILQSQSIQLDYINKQLEQQQIQNIELRKALSQNLQQQDSNESC